MKVLDKRSKFIVNKKVYLSKNRIKKEIGANDYFMNKGFYNIRPYDYVVEEKGRWAYFGKTCYLEDDIEKIKVLWEKHKNRKLEKENKKIEVRNARHEKVFDLLNYYYHIRKEFEKSKTQETSEYFEEKKEEVISSILSMIEGEEE